MNKVKIIAEAGVNHNGSLELACRLADEAARAGADIIKYQTFKAEKLVTAAAQKAGYQKQTTGSDSSQFEMLKSLELSYEQFRKLEAHCKGLGIEFMSTAFDSTSLGFLCQDLGVKSLKVSSGDLTNGPLLLEHARTGKDVIISSGMATLDEIEQALAVLAFGYLNAGNESSLDAFKKAFESDEGQKTIKEKVSLLNCTTEYPAPVDEVNLRVISTLRERFGLRTGYSDHTAGIYISIAAVAAGASIIEKHFTLDKNMDGPDHRASLEPGELAEMISAIRAVEAALGDGVKKPTPSELRNRPIARKSIIAAKKISAGEKYTTENLCIKRPGDGISPMHYWGIIGKCASRAYRIDEAIANGELS